ncbi:Oxidoreductase FAD/NAD(P)-binding protein [Macrophomina phaseolina MS6]|uniref:NADH-cytochrome b5 reductase n=1 Tax=Macrophomina phaseolina (strain MS6) TaxID=1126212 RepID=K2RJS7_MACPH|nr:Oxidoreductase FAD/NAD(P)-binding protein [Macrophomina phaseolina MS6]
MLPLSMRSLVPKVAQKLSERPNSPSLMDFWGGALTAASLNVLCLCFMASRFFEKHKPIESYPAYIRPAIPLPCPGANGKRKQVLDPGRYQSFTLIEKQQVARSVYRFTLRLPEEGVPLGLPLGQHIRVVARIDGQRVQRSYTPTSALDCGSTLELTVKVYPQGKMSNYLLNLPLNSEVSVSGPFGSFRDYHPGKWEQIGCIAGGSGITPIYQLVRAICENPIDSTKVYLLYGNETHEDILLRDELDELSRRHPTKLLAHHILAHPPPGWEGQSGWINIQMMQKLLPQPGDKTGYLICGPQGMVKAVKQNLEVMGGRDMVCDTSRVFVF